MGEDNKDKTAAAAQSKSPAEYSQEILRVYREKDYRKCVELVDKYLELPKLETQKHGVVSCTHFKIIRAGCWTMLDDVDIDTIYKCLREIIEADPKNSFAFYAYGLAQYRNGDFNESIESLRNAVKFNTSNAMSRALELKSKSEKIVDLFARGNFVMLIEFVPLFMNFFFSFLSQHRV